MSFDAAYALAQLGDRRGRARLYQALTDRDRAWDAIAVLEEVDDRDAVPALVRALGERGLTPELAVRAAAGALALAPDHPAARAHLVAALGHRKLPVRGLAIEQLGRVGGAWALGPLEALGTRWRGRDLRPAIVDAQAAIRAREAAP
ncbi:MAG: hypothetical protein IPL61_10540 [Myxococcales bacterium]|nr:hypothetical protein [Myxococcales bacterium]